MWKRTATAGLAGAMLMAAALQGITGARPAPAAVPPATGTIHTVAGGLGAGPGTNVSQSPIGVAARGGRVVSVDGPSEASDLPALDSFYPSVIRSLDADGGVQAPVGGLDVGGFSGDGGPATHAAFANVTAVATDGSGAVLVADNGNYRLRRISPTGVVTTVAGNGQKGPSGDGGPALAASFNWERALATAPDGTVYVADTYRVRRIDPAGVITTFAGSDHQGSSGDGLPATGALLNDPMGLAVGDDGTVYVADGNNGIRKIGPDGIIHTVSPLQAMSIAVDHAGTLYLGYDAGVRRLDPSGAVTTVAGTGEPGFTGDGGPATAARLSGRVAVAVAGDGRLYVADVLNRRIRVVAADGTITTAAGNGEASYSGDGGPAGAARFGAPDKVGLGPTGIYVVDNGNRRLRRIDPAGNVSTLRALSDYYQDMAVDAAGDAYLSEGHQVFRVTPAGTSVVVAGTGEQGDSGDGRLALAARLDTPTGLAFDGAGNLYIADRGDHHIRRLAPDGTISTVVGGPGMAIPDLGPWTQTPDVRAMTVDAEGAVLFPSSGGGVFKLHCGILSLAAIVPPTPSRFDGSIAVDRTGAMFVVTGDVVTRVGPDGSRSTVAGGGTATYFEGAPATSAKLFFPSGLALDSSGNLYVTSRDRVLRVEGVAAPAPVPGRPCDSIDRPAWAWGSNAYGQLGDGSNGRLVPDTDHPPLTGVTAVAAGAAHSLALRTDGTVWAWGYNALGQLGDGTTVDRRSPVRVAGLTGVTAVAAGSFHSLAVKADGTVWSWGWNPFGALGNDSTASSSTPVRVVGLEGVASVAGGLYHSLAVKRDGSLWSWGWNGLGQLGDGTTTERHRPVQVPGVAGARSVAAGYYHSLVATADGSAWAWGWNWFGQVGDGTAVDRHTPVRISGLSGVTAVAAGAYHSLGLTSGGSVFGWGWNAFGQVGDFTTVDRHTPVATGSPCRPQAIAAGALHSVSMSRDCGIEAWGWNGAGQLGINATFDAHNPWPVRNLPATVAIAGGAYHTLAAWDFSTR